MNRNAWVRQIHRWLSVVFTLAVIANFVAVAEKKLTAWVGFLALLPLGLLLLTGLYLFALPYAKRWRSRQRTTGHRLRGSAPGAL